MKKGNIVAIIGVILVIAGAWMYFKFQPSNAKVSAFNYEIQHTTLPSNETEITMGDGALTVVIEDEMLKNEVATLIDSKEEVLNVVLDTNKTASPFTLKATSGGVTQDFAIDKQSIDYTIAMKHTENQSKEVNRLVLKNDEETYDRLLEIFMQECQKKKLAQSKMLPRSW